jgi:hypothetical protein
MQWKNVPLKYYDKRYEVSDEGLIRNKQTGHLLRQRLNRRTGYLQVLFTFPDRRKNVNVHRMVLQAFKPVQNSTLQVNHIDEDKTNNRLSNLEWMTPKQNVNWGSHTDRQRDTLILHKPERKAIPIIITRKDGAKVQVTSIRQAAQWTKVSRNKIVKLLNSGKIINGYSFQKSLKVIK